MSIVVMSEKGQVTIPQDIRKKLNIGKGDPLLVDMAEDGSVRLRPAGVYPIEIYTDERIKEFERENRMTPLERRKLKKFLGS